MRARATRATLDSSLTPTDAVVSISRREVSGTGVVTEQGSGVLIAPDEVPTAAHLDCDPSGRLVSGC